MEGTSVNYLAVVVAAIALFVLGAIWYSPALFGKRWMSLVGRTVEQLKQGVAIAYIGGFLASVIMALVLSYLIRGTGAGDAVAGMQTALWCWGGFVAPSILTLYLFTRHRMALVLIDAGYYLVGMIVMGGILGAWM